MFVRCDVYEVLAHAAMEDHREKEAPSARIVRSRRRDARRQERAHDAWSRDAFFTDLRRATAPITNAINGSPKESERLRKSREQVREGKVHWGVEDEL